MSPSQLDCSILSSNPLNFIKLLASANSFVPAPSTRALPLSDHEPLSLTYKLRTLLRTSLIIITLAQIPMTGFYHLSLSKSRNQSSLPAFSPKNLTFSLLKPELTNLYIYSTHYTYSKLCCLLASLFLSLLTVLFLKSLRAEYTC